jgi:hypothetical protein
MPQVERPDYRVLGVSIFLFLKIIAIRFVTCFQIFRRNILGISSGIEQVGTVKLDLLISLLVSWLIVYFSIFRGMKNSQIVT